VGGTKVSASTSNNTSSPSGKKGSTRRHRSGSNSSGGHERQNSNDSAGSSEGSCHSTPAISTTTINNRLAPHNNQSAVQGGRASSPTRTKSPARPGASGGTASRGNSVSHGPTTTAVGRGQMANRPTDTSKLNRPNPSQTETKSKVDTKAAEFLSLNVTPKTVLPGQIISRPGTLTPNKNLSPSSSFVYELDPAPATEDNSPPGLSPSPAPVAPPDQPIDSTDDYSGDVQFDSSSLVPDVLDYILTSEQAKSSLKIPNSSLLLQVNDTSVMVWDLRQQQCIGIFLGHTAPIRSIQLEETAGIYCVKSGSEKEVLTWKYDSMAVTACSTV